MAKKEFFFFIYQLLSSGYPELRWKGFWSNIQTQRGLKHWLARLVLGKNRKETSLATPGLDLPVDLFQLWTAENLNFPMASFHRTDLCFVALGDPSSIPTVFLGTLWPTYDKAPTVGESLEVTAITLCDLGKSLLYLVSQWHGRRAHKMLFQVSSKKANPWFYYTGVTIPWYKETSDLQWIHGVLEGP